VAPEQLNVEEPVAFAAAVATGGEPIKPVQHAVADSLSAGGAKKPHRRGDAPPQTGVDALPTTRCEIGALLPAGDTPAKLASAHRPLAPIGPRNLAAADTVATGAEVVLAHTHLCRDGALLEQLHDEFKKPVAFTAAVATGGEPINPEQHAAVEEQERRAHEALDGLDGSAKKRHRRDDAPPKTGPASSMLPGGDCKISSDKISFDNTLEPDRLSYATLVATHVLLLEGETPTSHQPRRHRRHARRHPCAPSGGRDAHQPPASSPSLPPSRPPMCSIRRARRPPRRARRPPASPPSPPPSRPPMCSIRRARRPPATSLIAVAAAVATGGEPVEPEQHAAADEPEQCALGSSTGSTAMPTQRPPSRAAGRTSRCRAPPTSRNSARTGIPTGLMVTP